MMSLNGVVLEAGVDFEIGGTADSIAFLTVVPDLGDTWWCILIGDALDIASISDGSVSTNKLADGAVTTAKIEDGAITGAKFASGGVDTDIIVDEAITSAKIEDDAVTVQKIAPSAVGSSQIASNAITKVKMANSSVDTAELVTDAVTGAKIANDAVDSEHLATGAVDTAALASSSVTDAKLSGVIGDDHLPVPATSIRAWCSFDGNGAVTIHDSYNISGVTDTGTGQFTFTFTDDLPDTNFGFLSGSQGDNDARVLIESDLATRSVSEIEIVTRYVHQNNSGQLDLLNSSFAILSTG